MKLQEIEYGIDVAVETIITLACERKVTATQVLDRLCCVTIQPAFRGYTVLRRIVAVIALVIKRSGNALIIGRNDAASEHRPMTVLPMIHLGNGVGLHQVLISVPDVI